MDVVAIDGHARPKTHLVRMTAAVARVQQLKCDKVHQAIFRKDHGDD
jgi:hypothetical protein